MQNRLSTITEYRSRLAESQNIEQNLTNYEAQVEEMTKMIDGVKETRDDLKKQKKSNDEKIDTLQITLASEIDDIAKEYEEEVQLNDVLEMRGFQSDEEQKELIDGFQKEADFFTLLEAYTSELKISH
jgi:hypothetical protein